MPVKGAQSPSEALRGLREAEWGEFSAGCDPAPFLQ